MTQLMREADTEVRLEETTGEGEWTRRRTRRRNADVAVQGLDWSGTGKVGAGRYRKRAAGVHRRTRCAQWIAMLRRQ